MLSRDEPDAADVVRSAMVRDGVRVLLQARVERVAQVDGARTCTVRHEGRTENVAAESILVATGRVPRVTSLGLEEAGVAHGPEGLVVNDRLQTSNPRVFAAGDVALPIRFTHAADAMARLVIRNAIFFGRARASALVIPHCTYTAPELAQVGPTRQELGTAGRAFDQVEVPFSAVDRAAIEGETGGFFRVLLARGTDRIVAGTIVGAHAGTLSGELSAAVTAKRRLGELGAAVRPYPTMSEVFRKAADQWQRRRLTPGAKRVLSGWFRVFG